MNYARFYANERGGWWRGEERRDERGAHSFVTSFNGEYICLAGKTIYRLTSIPPFSTAIIRIRFIGWDAKCVQFIY